MGNICGGKNNLCKHTIIKSHTYNLRYIAAVAVEDDLERVPQAGAILEQSILDKNRW